MTDYSASVTADFSGYTNSTQQAIALTREFTAANEGMIGMVGRTGTRAILAFNDALGLSGKILKANVSEAANYQQMLGRVSASAKAAGKDVSDTQRMTMSVARNLTGNIASAEGVINSIISSGETRNKQINETAKAMVNLSAATGESGTALAGNIRTLQRAYGYMPEASRITALGDSVVATSKKFGASATDVTDFAKSISPFAKQVGLASTSLVGFSTAFARVGEDGFRAANVFSKVLSDIDSAVREGSPTLSTYAETMGLTYKQAENLAKSNPAEFLIKFTEGLDKQGDKAIRTLEALGLEGVRSQKALSALTAANDLPELIKTAQQSYGDGTTAEAAQEQLRGLNEQTAKLEESLRQVVAGSGAPFLGFLENVAAASTAMADKLAGLVNSSGFQALAGTAMAGTVTAGIGSKLLGGMYAATSLGSMLPMIGAGRLGAAGQFIGANRRNFALAGGAGLVGGQMMGSSSMSMLGMGAMAAAAMAGPGSFGKVRTGYEFLTRDAATLARVPFPQWGQDRGRGWRMDNLERESPVGALTAATLASGVTPGGMFKATGSQDQLATIVKWMKDRPGFSEESIAEFKKTMTLLDTKGRVFGRVGLADLNDALSAGKLDDGMITKVRNATLAGAPTQTAGMRGRAVGIAAGSTVTNLGAGFGTQGAALAGTLATNPVGWAVGGALAAGAGAMYLNNRGDARDEALRSTVLHEAESVAAAFGLIAPKFDGLAKSTDEVASSFEQLSGILGGSNELTPGQYAAIDGSGDPSNDLTLQNRRALFQTTGSQLQNDSQLAELLGTYGTLDDGRWKAAMATDFKRMGKTDDEFNMAMADAAKAREGGAQGILGVAIGAVKRSDDSFLQAAFPMMRDDSGQQLIERWAADNPQGLSNEQMMGEIVKAMETVLPGMSQRSIDDMVNTVWETAGLSDYEKPDFVSEQGGRGGRRQSREDAATVNARETQEINDKYVKAGLTSMEATLKGAFMGGPGLAGDMAQAMNTAAGTVGAQERLESGAIPASGMGREIARRDGEQTPDAVALGLAEVFTKALDDYKEDDLATNIRSSQEIAGGAMTFAAGDTSVAGSELRKMQFTMPADSPQGRLTAAAEGEVAFIKSVERMGMTDFGALRSDMDSAVTKRNEAAEFLAKDEGSEKAQMQFAEADAAMKEAYTNQIQWMQNLVKARRSLDKQMEYAQEDYQESVEYAEEDFQTNRERSQEQFDTQQKYAKQDFYISMRQMAEDYATSMARSERDYLKQRRRIYEDHDLGMARRAEDAARAMYDPFKRMSVEQTWSGGGLLTNLKQQQEAFDKQVANLDKARAAGLEQDTLDTLGLNDPNKAQQLERLLRDINAGSVNVGELNAVSDQRTATAGQLFGEENDMGVRRQEEDYRKQLTRMAEDRKTWLKDSEADYSKARRRANQAFDRSMERAQEGFDRSMRYMEESQELSLKRMEKAHNKQLKRAEEAFQMSFEAVTSDYATLAETTTGILEGETQNWEGVIEDGMDSMRKVFTDKSSGIDSIMSDALGKQIKEQYGANGQIVKSWETLLKMLNTMGGDSSSSPWAGGMPASDYRGGLEITGGRGRVTQGWGVNNSRYSSGRHSGVDIGAPHNTPVYSTVSGKVIRASYDKAYGNSVMIDVDNSSTGLLLGHMSALAVRGGDRVVRGTPIGRVGSTGFSTGNHLHVEARRQSRAGDYPHSSNFSPYAYMWQGGITQGKAAMVGENVYPEAVIPLNHRGIDVLAQVFDKAFGQALLNQALTGGGQTMRTSTTIISEDHSVNINGEVTVVSADPERVGRELERKARDMAIIQPTRRA